MRTIVAERSSYSKEEDSRYINEGGFGLAMFQVQVKLIFALRRRLLHATQKYNTDNAITYTNINNCK